MPATALPGRAPGGLCQHGAMREDVLVGPVELAGRLGEPGLRVLDATVHLRRESPGAPYTIHSGREDHERAHIPGAAFADLAHELSSPDAPHAFALPDAERFAAGAGALGIGPGTRVVAYSQRSPMWATRLWWLLRYFGFEDVRVLDGGMRGWLASGLPVRAGPESPPRVKFAARPREHMLANLDEVAALSCGEGAACLVNALSPQAFRGDGPGAYSRPGRIPGSVNLHWELLLDPDTERFRSDAEIEDALGSLGEPGTPPVVAYCGAGVSATVDLFALELIGRSGGRLYDGSLTQWSADPSLPMEVG